MNMHKLLSYRNFSVFTRITRSAVVQRLPRPTSICYCNKLSEREISTKSTLNVIHHRGKTLENLASNSRYLCTEYDVGSSDEIFDPPSSISSHAHCGSMSAYREMYKRSVDDPAGFWSELAAATLYWKVAPPVGDKFYEYNFDSGKGPVKISWMKGGQTNVCYSILDHNIETRGIADKIAFYWEGNDPDDFTQITYKQLLNRVCQFSNVLKAKGLKKGDCVAIYMPMIPELVISMLACARLGIIHSIVFAGFSANAVAERIQDGQCSAVLTADGGWRGDKLLNLKSIVDGAIKICSQRGRQVDTCIVVKHVSSSANQNSGSGRSTTDSDLSGVGKRPCNKLQLDWVEGRDSWYHEEIEGRSTECLPVWLDAEDPLFILYTSGSTGKPKGVLHTQAGYLTHVATAFKYVFDYQPDDVYWCTADIGWVTGHSLVCYGPLANGATSVMYEGVPVFPRPDRFWRIIDKYGVTKFYTAPTAIRAVMKYGDDMVTKNSSLASLKIIGTAGEPINPKTWHWYNRIVGKSRCAIVDTFWQTETGGPMLTPLPGATPTKPGSATFPFFGVVPEILTEEGKVVEGEGEGYLVFRRPWPGMMRTVFGDHARFESTYFEKFPGYYTSGDGARRDKDGYLWVTGRIDDMLNVSGHLISTSEVESVLGEHPLVAETAVVAHPHAVKGECLYCFVTLSDGSTFNEELETELKEHVRQRIGPFAQPEHIQETPSLPKTRSGKIMRRVLRKVAMGDRDLGDISAIADESVIEQLYQASAGKK